MECSHLNTLSKVSDRFADKYVEQITMILPTILVKKTLIGKDTMTKHLG
ncbi:MAG: hypothetical protein V7L20_22535 [Nostoc sp.]